MRGVALLALLSLGTGLGCACSRYRYSTCPGRCARICTPSQCGDGPNAVCTADCDGPGRCVPRSIAGEAR